MSLDLQLLQCLSDGRFYSGEVLANQLGVSRTTIWKEVKRLESRYAVQVQSVKGRGYRLSQALELLDEEKIRSFLSPRQQPSISRIEILPVVDSTNRYLLAAASQGASSVSVVFAEQQTAGRGRHGRIWVSPFGCNLYCSLLWKFDLATSVLSGLGIVIAVAVVKALAHYSDQLTIKWPNDILFKGQKVAGILMEMQGEANGPASVVIGVGINVKMPVSSAQQIDQAWTDLSQLSNQRVSRNELAASLLSELTGAIEEFEGNGLASFIDAWMEKDMLLGRQVDITMGENCIQGIAKGIDQSGALRVLIDGELRSFMAGEISLQKDWERSV